MKKLLIAAFLITAAIQLNSQVPEITKWDSFTSYLHTNSLNLKGDTVLVATSGGVYFLDLKSEEMEQYNITSGLSNNNASYIYYDENSEKTIVGYDSGIFDFFDGNKWRPNFDISNHQNNVNRNINYITSKDGKVYLSGGFGLGIYDPEENIFIDDVIKFSDIDSRDSDIRTIKFNEGNIYLATSEGIVYTKLTDEIKNPTLWTAIRPIDDFDEENIIDIEVTNDTMYATSGDNIYFVNEDDKLENVYSLESEDIIGLFIHNEQLHYFYDDRIINYSTGNVVVEIDQNITEVDSRDNRIIIGTEEGIILYENNELKEFAINSPVTNAIADIFIDSQGSLWAATGLVGAKGIMRYKDGEWTNFNRENNPEIISETFLMINEIDNGRIISGTFGGGVYIIDRNDSITHYDHTNSPLEGSSEGEGYVITGDVYEDPDGNDWIVNWGNVGNGPLFVIKKNDGSFTTLFNCNSTLERSYFKTVVDLNGTKWVSSSGPNVANLTQASQYGLVYYNESGTLEDRSDDICGKITPANSDILTLVQTALEIDHDGTLWVGSINGVNRIINPSAVLSGNELLTIDIKSLEGQNVRDITTDALNNKWVATNNGVFIVDPDGENILKNINKDNSPLTTDNIYMMEYDEDAGKFYLATDDGLYVLSTTAIKPLAEYELKVYPQPFRQNRDDILKIEGLAEESDIRIVTVDGELVKKIKVNSRIATWDGTNEFGNKVSEGVYLLYAVSQNSNESSVIKVAVVNN